MAPEIASHHETQNGPLTLGSLFDGIGVFPLAASRQGIVPRWASEIEKAPVSITKRHFPEMEHLGDITKLHGGNIPPVHIITFGSPCQNLSQMGDRLGLAGAKSGLFYHAVPDHQRNEGCYWKSLSNYRFMGKRHGSSVIK